jgi:hypothetical protein
MDEVMALLPGLPNPDVCSTALHTAVFIYMKSGQLATAARASAQATEAAAGLTPHHRVHALGWQLMLASVTGRWDEVRGPTRPRPSGWWTPTWPRQPPAAGRLHPAELRDRQRAGRRRGRGPSAGGQSEGLGMEGGRWYQGWFEPPKVRLALARHQNGVSRRTRRRRASTGSGSRLRPSWTLWPRSATASASRQKRRTGCSRAPSPSRSRSARSASPGATGHCSGRRWSDSRQWTSPGTQSKPGTCCESAGRRTRSGQVTPPPRYRAQRLPEPAGQCPGQFGPDSRLAGEGAWPVQESTRISAAVAAGQPAGTSTAVTGPVTPPAAASWPCGSGRRGSAK